MSKKFLIKNVKSDRWAEFLFQEMRKDEKRPNGPGWMTIKEICALSENRFSYHSFRLVISELIQKKECEQFMGNIRSNRGVMIKCVWYRHKNTIGRIFLNKTFIKYKNKDFQLEKIGSRQNN